MAGIIVQGHEKADKKSKKGGKWRKYHNYCFSRGINLHCDGLNYWQECKKKNNLNPTATFENYKGGSNKLEHQWGG